MSKSNEMRFNLFYAMCQFVNLFMVNDPRSVYTSETAMVDLANNTLNALTDKEVHEWLKGIEQGQVFDVKHGDIVDTLCLRF